VSKSPEHRLTDLELRASGIARRRTEEERAEAFFPRLIARFRASSSQKISYVAALDSVDLR
jgi:hypothetical protein